MADASASGDRSFGWHCKTCSITDWSSGNSSSSSRLRCLVSALVRGPSSLFCDAALWSACDIRGGALPYCDRGSLCSGCGGAARGYPEYVAEWCDDWLPDWKEKCREIRVTATDPGYCHIRQISVYLLRWSWMVHSNSTTELFSFLNNFNWNKLMADKPFILIKKFGWIHAAKMNRGPENWAITSNRRNKENENKAYHIATSSSSSSVR